MLTPYKQPNTDGSVLVVIGAAHRAALPATMDGVRRAVARDGLLNAARASGHDAIGGAARLAVVCSSPDDLDRKLAFASEKLAQPHTRRIRERSGIYYTEEPLARSGTLAIMFPGEGAQYPNMLSDLCAEFPQARRGFDLIDHAFDGRRPHERPSATVFAAADAVEPHARLWTMDGATEAVFAANLGLHTMLELASVKADAVVGHSTGDYAALLAGGAIEVNSDAELVVHLRGLNQIYEELARGGRIASGVLLAVGGASREHIWSTLGPHSGLTLALDNCDHQLVLCGGDSEVESATTRLRAAGILCERLPFERAYHTPLFEAFCQPVREFLHRLPMRTPRITTYSCATAAPYPDDVDALRTIAASQWATPVRFVETVEAMYRDGVRVFVEAGPRGNLTAFVHDILSGRPHLAVASNVAVRPGLLQLHHTLAQLASHGVDIVVDGILSGHQHSSARLPAPPAPPRAGRAMTIKLGLPVLRIGTPLAMDAPLHHEPSTAGFAPKDTTGQAPAAGGARVQVLQQHFQTMERFLDLQRELMCTWSQAHQPQAQASVVHDAGHAQSRATPPKARVPVPASVSLASAGDLAAFVEPDGNGERALPQPPAPAEAMDAAASRDLLLSIVSDKTGYPTEMLDLTADIEADYGIDSIKRVEIVGAFLRRAAAEQHDLEGVSQLRTLGAVLDAASNRGAAPSTPRIMPTVPLPAPKLPLLAADVRWLNSNEVSATFTLLPAEQTFLRHHTLGRNVSVFDDSLTGVPVLALAVSLELLAEAAALLNGARPTRLTDVKVHRWLVAPRPVDLEVRARRVEGRPHEVRACILDASAGTGSAAEPAVEAVVCFDAKAQPDVASLVGLGADRPPTTAPARLYIDGMFNGPCFQSVASIDGVGDSSVRATLRVPSVPLVSDSDPSVWLADPVVVDGAGQVVGFWAAERLEQGFVIFPTAVEEVYLPAAPLPVGAAATCTAQICLVDAHRIRSDVEVTDAAGALVVRLSGWHDRRFPISREEARFVLDPTHTMLSEQCDRLFMVGEHVRCCRIDADSPTLDGFGAMAHELLAHLILSAVERTQWEQAQWPFKRRHEWLRGRLAAKDAVRLLLLDLNGPALAPADIVIVPEADGRPTAAGAWVDLLGWTPLISISHSGGAAFAIAADPRRCSGVGVDVELLANVNAPDVEVGGFHDRERRLLPESEVERQEWIVRCWSAREAAMKALTVAERGALSIHAVELASGRVDVRYSRAGSPVDPSGAETIPVHTVRKGNDVFAVAISRAESHG